MYFDEVEILASDHNNNPMDFGPLQGGCNQIRVSEQTKRRKQNEISSCEEFEHHSNVFNHYTKEDYVDL